MTSRLVTALALAACACGRLGFEPLRDASITVSSACADRVVLLADTFDDTIADAQWMIRQDPGYTVREDQGVLDIAYAPVVPATMYGGYVQTTANDVRGGCARAALVMAPNPATAAYAYLRVGTMAEAVFFTVQAGKLYALTYSEPTTEIVREDTHDPVAHVHLRMCEEAGTVSWQTSPDLAAWVPFAEANPTPLDATSATIELGAATAGQPESDAGRVQWDEVEACAP